MSRIRRILVIVLPACAIALGAKYVWDVYAIHAAMVQRQRDDLAAEIKSIRAGDSNSIYLYETSRTDQLLQEIGGMPGVESLNLELTDVTDEGMREVASLPNLGELTIYGGRPGMGDKGLNHVSGVPGLKVLSLINTKVTDDGLSVLKEFRELRSLTLYCQVWRGDRLTDAAIGHLKNLDRLEKLALGGGWISRAAYSELKEALPNCEMMTY